MAYNDVDMMPMRVVEEKEAGYDVSGVATTITRGRERGIVALDRCSSSQSVLEEDHGQSADRIHQQRPKR